jgi:hypothetical protein
MTQAKESPKPLFNKPFAGQIIPLHPIVDEKLSIPEDVWDSLKNWKTELQYVGEECDYLLKIIKWNNPDIKLAEDKRVLKNFEQLINKNHGQLLHSINELEKEVVAAFFDAEIKTKNFLGKLKEVEAELKAFNQDFSIIKLKVLKLLVSNSRITFF